MQLTTRPMQIASVGCGERLRTCEVAEARAQVVDIVIVGIVNKMIRISEKQWVRLF